SPCASTLLGTAASPHSITTPPPLKPGTTRVGRKCAQPARLPPRDALPGRFIGPVAPPARPGRTGRLDRTDLRPRDRVMPAPAYRVPSLGPQPRRVRADELDVRRPVPGRSATEDSMAMGRISAVPTVTGRCASSDVRRGPARVRLCGGPRTCGPARPQ